MKKSILIIGAGSGLSSGVAEKFGREGFKVSLISRSADNLERMKKDLETKGIAVNYSKADAGNAIELRLAIKALETEAGGFDVVLYNAAVVKAFDILEEDPATLTKEFAVNVASALASLQATYEGLKQRKGAFLLTGGGLAVRPAAAYGSLSIGKAGLRSLAFQLHDRLKNDDIYAGLLTVAGFINPESETHSPELLADLFWKMYVERSQVELHQ
ncbi:short-chain dehydrogenase [Dyadobacter beijingensis]|uniref:Short-chain dehydrogenase n=1 Tax=Dyadobacter beijingensis TaxID=365489 RepID=A0ABQ2IIM0_9BACT|nr:SDR family NAD(P)-dependent oxidoreductase [Dyadobacter beijingensis]GGN13100.1 short-chain dehydrogenase [Dyadobacter beijingensis]